MKNKSSDPKLLRSAADLALLDRTLASPAAEGISSKVKQKARQVYLTLSQDTLQRALRADVVQAGFDIAGTWPFNPNNVLDQVPGFGLLPAEISVPCLDSLPKVFAHAAG